MKPDTTGKNCACGAGFANSQPQYKGRATLYTRMGAVECFIYSVCCQAGQCEITHEAVAKEMGIFFTTGVTCLGDEMGWDFISLVKRTKISFSGYCGEIKGDIGQTMFFQETLLVQILLSGGSLDGSQLSKLTSGNMLIPGVSIPLKSLLVMAHTLE